uniref:Uncharacterized protein n=1 Tax=Arundo donax TaxID=35708 RepID=A0A0A9CJD9_ARUDO
MNLDMKHCAVTRTCTMISTVEKEKKINVHWKLPIILLPIGEQLYDGHENSNIQSITELIQLHHIKSKNQTRYPRNCIYLKCPLPSLAFLCSAEPHMSQ